MTNLDEVQVSRQEVIFFSSSFGSYSSQVSPYLFTLTKENKRKNKSSRDSLTAKVYHISAKKYNEVPCHLKWCIGGVSVTAQQTSN